MSEPPTAASALTAEELFYLSVPDKQTELVRGRLIVRERPGYRHGIVALKIARLIADYVDDHGLGIVVAAETGFKLFSNPDTVRAADAAYLSRHRAPDPPPSGYLALAPDLAVAAPRRLTASGPQRSGGRTGSRMYRRGWRPST